MWIVGTDVKTVEHITVMKTNLKLHVEWLCTTFFDEFYPNSVFEADKTVSNGIQYLQFHLQMAHCGYGIYFYGHNNSIDQF